MRGYGDLSYFAELNFQESLDCYLHLAKGFENELTVESLGLLFQRMFSGDNNGDGGANTEENIDNLVDMFF